MTKSLKRLYAAVFASALTLLVLSSATAADTANLVIKGSTTILPIAQRMAEAFEQYCQEDVKVWVSGGGSAEGILALVMGEADIATSSSFITEHELMLAQQRNVYPVPFRIANDCILPVVHISNPLRDISSDDLRDIYRGRITNWNQLGGPDLAIEAISRDLASGTYEVWHDIIMERETIATEHTLKHSSADVVRAVSTSPGAIGYISLGYLNAYVKPVKVNGVMGSRKTVLDGTYLINRPLFMFTSNWPEGRRLEFINFVLDPDRGQEIVKQGGLIPLR
ncbi:MAG: phosphate ABC transporter substrate-binding protein [Gammaproteobacteria bacterium]|nr:phosphate ABC transporter substrate-binding protein [Gammaproteobacteria bacterium]